MFPTQIISDKTKVVATIMTSDWIKVLMEGVYDEAAKTRFISYLRGLPSVQRKILISALFFIHATVAEQLPDDTPVKRLLFEIIDDVPPEMAKRIDSGPEYPAIKEPAQEDLVSAINTLTKILSTKSSEVQTTVKTSESSLGLINSALERTRQSINSSKRRVR